VINNDSLSPTSKFFPTTFAERVKTHLRKFKKYAVPKGNMGIYCKAVPVVKIK
jgi:hypothetical protein